MTMVMTMLVTKGTTIMIDEHGGDLAMVVMVVVLMAVGW